MKVFNKATNPIRLDPTKTNLIRRKFQAEIVKRIKLLIADIKDFFIDKDALALSPRKLMVLVQPREFEFRSDPDKLKAFMSWLQQMIDARVFSVPAGAPADRPWLSGHIESAFKKGMMNAWTSSKQARLMEELGIGEMSLEQFLRNSFNSPEVISKVRLLATRAFEDLKGVTAQMASQMNQILSQGMVEGVGPEVIARRMVKAITDLTSARALRIARTETIFAHAEGQLDAFEKLGVEDLGLKAEWTTAGDDRVCPFCHAMEGRVFSIDEARGMIPLHPNCRCAWMPAIT